MRSTRVVLRVARVSKTYSMQDGSQLLVLADMSFCVGEGEILGVVGPSGCGKTTLLRLVAGLISPTSGDVELEGSIVKGPDLRMILVFQEYTKSLFPWRTVAGNVRFGLEQSNTPRREWSRAVQGALTLVGLGDFANEYPWRISGGMQQRVALARAIVHQPRVLLMDEPFGSLDAYTRYALEDQLLALSSSLTMTIVLVTHDIDEAVYMSDRVLVLSRRPATILEDRPIALSRPREQIETRSNASFGELRGAVHRLLQAGEINSCAR